MEHSFTKLKLFHEIHYTRLGATINHLLHQAWIQYQVAHLELRSYTMPCKLACLYPKTSSKISLQLYNRSFNGCVFCNPTVIVDCYWNNFRFLSQIFRSLFFRLPHHNNFAKIISICCSASGMTTTTGSYESHQGPWAPHSTYSITLHYSTTNFCCTETQPPSEWSVGDRFSEWW